jgi:hypothetical protein
MQTPEKLWLAWPSLGIPAGTGLGIITAATFGSQIAWSIVIGAALGLLVGSVVGLSTRDPQR